MKTSKSAIIFIMPLVIVGIFFVRGGGQPNQPESDTQAATTNQSTSTNPDTAKSPTRVSGEITNINASRAVVDGPYIISLRTTADNQVTVEVPSMGIRSCAASSSIVSISKLAVGQQVAVSGMRRGGAIVPCDSNTHYLRIESNTTSSEGER